MRIESPGAPAQTVRRTRDNAPIDALIGVTLMSFDQHDAAGRSRDRLEDLVQRDRRTDEQVSARLRPTRSTDIVNDSERRLDRSSRSFRRLTVRADAAEQFRTDRQAFREALAGANQSSRPDAATNDAAPGESGKKTDQAGPPVANSDADSVRARRADAAPDATRAPNAPVGASPDAPRDAPGQKAVAQQPSVPPSSAAAPSVAPAAVAESNPTAPGRVPSVVRVSGGRAQPAAARNASNVSAVAKSQRGAFRAHLGAAKPSATRGADSADRKQRVERIVRVIRSHARDRRSTTILRLDPPEIGNVRVRMDLHKDVLRLRIDTQSDAAHRLLRDDIESLRRGLESAGIRLEHVEVRPPQNAPNGAGADGSQNPQAWNGGGGESRDPDAEHPRRQGRDSTSSAAAQTAGLEHSTQRVAEPLVNLFA